MSKKKTKAPLIENKKGEMALSPEHVDAIKKTEDIGTSMMQVAQEYTLAVEQVLIEEFNFTEEQLRHMETRLREMLVTLADVERNGLSVLSFHDMEKVSEIAKIRYNRLKGEKVGIELPTKGDIKKLSH